VGRAARRGEGGAGSTGARARRHAHVEGAWPQLLLHCVLSRLLVAVQLDHLERGAPLGELALPVAQHRERHDDQVRLPVEQLERRHAEHRDRLRGKRRGARVRARARACVCVCRSRVLTGGGSAGGGGRGGCGGRLQRLAESHLIRENPVELTRSQREHPVEALDLRAHRHGENGGHRGANTKRGVRG
jgi:hypothetical protein